MLTILCLLAIKKDEKKEVEEKERNIREIIYSEWSDSVTK